ncbi:MAG TPA: hypothetical protein VM889_01825 [Candidatus Thermoplasmatota archaeon]|nr:hypothetical protein [Candidatus Thermoplasmatota archaeon]
MTATRSARTALFVALGLMTIAFAFPASVADRHCPNPDGTPCEPPKECFEKGNSAAAIGNIQAGTVTLQTQVGNSAVELPRKDLAIAISTTGQLDVEVVHKCVREYTFSWTKTSMIGGPTSFTTTVYPNCFAGVDTYAIPVGWDLVDIHMTLTATGCDGATHSDVRDIKVVDPPLVVPAL